MSSSSPKNKLFALLDRERAEEHQSMEAAAGGRPEAGSSSGSPDAIAGDKEEEVVVVEETDDEDEDEDDEHHAAAAAAAAEEGFVPGPLVSLKDHIEKDKDDESLRRWKEKLLGCIDGQLNGGQMEPEVTFHSVGIICEGCAEVVTPLPILENQSHVLFTLKEGSQYRLKLTFTVKHNIVSGLSYVNTVWKRGLQVDQIKGMLGTFGPQHDPYEHLLEEETTPSGPLARGIYSAKLMFEDDDKRCHLELDYSFEIKKR